MKNSDIEKIVAQVLLVQQDKSDKAASETVSRLFETLDKKIVELGNKMDSRLDIVEKRTEWIQDTFSGGKVISKVSTVFVKFLITVTAISGSILWLKDWLKK
jgi:septation ring formation regulator EzrA